MFKPLVRTCILSSALLVSLNGHTAPTDPLAVVNGETITQQEYDDYVKARAKQNPSQNEKVKPETLIEEMIQRELLKQDALKKGIDKNPEFIQKVEFMRESLLMAMGMHDYLEKHPIDDAALHSEYDRQIALIKVPQEYKVRHILVETESDAKAIIAELDEGKDFGELAKEKSKDPGSAKQSGDLGWITTQKVVPKFGEAVEKLEKGKYSATPVKTQFGWHIVQVDDSRAAAALPPFESVKDKIEAALQFKLMQQYLSDLKNQAKIEIIKQSP
ncbi:PpiC-type peptidyl-prolyl cis-trans isomerase [Candidatus Thiomargarita nelsonii]|uniref:peptidylprolyl isomerase n=1 Tax=Candidatus Thiomargarita nelsonii TaxID=1003181 RepID=A0A176S5Z2_9GAMM|nr:PpiC-type peptidyl-prolyl cis-trans isomerase [Candidatus Thiomargarita nelsonii]